MFDPISSERVQEIAREDGDSSGVEVRSMASELLVLRSRVEVAERMAKTLESILFDSKHTSDRALPFVLDDIRRALTEWKETEPS